MLLIRFTGSICYYFMFIAVLVWSPSELEAQSVASQLVGKWQAISLQRDGNIVPVKDVLGTTEVYQTFKENKEVEAQTGDIKTSGTWSLDRSEKKISLDMVDSEGKRVKLVWDLLTISDTERKVSIPGVGELTYKRVVAD